MIELMVTVCSILSTTPCKNISLVYSSEDVTLLQCQMGGHFALAEWAAAHPNWSTGRWQCRMAGQYAKA